MDGTMPTASGKARFTVGSNVMETVRDRLWLWGHDSGALNAEWNFPRPSRITPVEAAIYLNVPNLLMVKYGGLPVLPYEQYAIPMRSLKRVAWSIVGARGEQSQDEREHVLELATRMPNLTGLVMDDFINWDTGEPEVSVEELDALHERLQLPDRWLDLMMILYTHQLDIDLSAHLAYCNQVSFWTWRSADLIDIEANFERFKRLVPNHQCFLGCYMWDFGVKGAPIQNLDLLKRECELGLEWLQQGRIEGMIFLPSSVVDLELESVEWVHRWIDEVGDEQLFVAY
jgi:hypothetical protein